MYVFIPLFVIALAGHLAHTYEHVREERGQKPLMGEVLMHLAIMGGWISFFAMVSFDPFKTELPEAITVSGAVLFLAGLVIAFAAGLEKRGFKEEKKLITSGIYSKVRHPYYTGLVLACVGYPLLFQRPVSLAIALIFFIPLIAYWKRMEERDLVKRFREYKEYMKRTWF